MRQLNVFLNLGVQKLKIAIRGRVLLCMFFCVLNLDPTRWVAMVIRGVNLFKWEVWVASGPRYTPS